MWFHPWEVVQRVFEATMVEGCWPHRQKFAPKHEILYVYIIIENKLVYRCNYIGHIKTWEDYPLATGGTFLADYPHILFSGPIVKAPGDIPLKGFRGFRYCTELF
jgi:hypothetical protein